MIKLRWVTRSSIINAALDQVLGGPSGKRKVIFSEYVQNQDTFRWELREIGEATFHQFGFDYEEFETGPGNFSTAIIELADGTVKNIPVHQIKFKDAKP